VHQNSHSATLVVLMSVEHRRKQHTAHFIGGRSRKRMQKNTSPGAMVAALGVVQHQWWPQQRDSREWQDAWVASRVQLNHGTYTIQAKPRQTNNRQQLKKLTLLKNGKHKTTTIANFINANKHANTSSVTEITLTWNTSR
jgi:hypothetical protein